jgi:hypothetical protein
LNLFTFLRGRIAPNALFLVITFLFPIRLLWLLNWLHRWRWRCNNKFKETQEYVNKNKHFDLDAAAGLDGDNEAEGDGDCCCLRDDEGLLEEVRFTEIDDFPLSSWLPSGVIMVGVGLLCCCCCLCSTCFSGGFGISIFGSLGLTFFFSSSSTNFFGISSTVNWESFENNLPSSHAKFTFFI